MIAVRLCNACLCCVVCVQRGLGHDVRHAGALRAPHLRLQLRGHRSERHGEYQVLFSHRIKLIITFLHYKYGALLLFISGLLLLADGHLPHQVSMSDPKRPSAQPEGDVALMFSPLLL